MTWVAFDRAIKSAERFGLKGPIDRWKMLRDTICRDVCDKGFDAEENAFVESYGSRMLDASILLLPSVGFLPASDPRVKGTLEAIERQMMPDGFVLRHDPRELPEQQQPAEGAFLACSLWLADAYTLAGEFDKAQALFDRVVASAGVLWPDGSTGTFTTDAVNTTWEAVDAYHITHVLSGKAVTQPLVTRNAAGGITAKPALTVA